MIYSKEVDNMVRIFKMAKFPIVCSNYDFTGTELAKVLPCGYCAPMN